MSKVQALIIGKVIELQKIEQNLKKSINHYISKATLDKHLTNASRLFDEIDALLLANQDKIPDPDFFTYLKQARNSLGYVKENFRIKSIKTNTTMPEVTAPFDLKMATALVQPYDGSPVGLDAFVDSVNLLAELTITPAHIIIAVKFVKLRLNASNKICSFLVDTGADISILKFGAINPNWTYNPDNRCSIRGITTEEKVSYGTINCLIDTENYALESSFHLVGNDFPIPTDGILGRDFLARYKCEINYDSWMLTVYYNSACIQLPIYDNLNGPFVIPARSEVIRQLSSLNIDSDIVVESAQIQPGVFYASTIVNKLL
ncbi:uncharacterized protein LOC129747381 [Uranotaenia lowii]|uniref:uncharacterized protein LOC129747381 n=1 Tax=Uranotaenia lowii TaxID=190385 RepID=UPI00247A2029|nr:uncharacterized protein LOC129747381 [Uranotaenia lowii]